MKNELKAKFLQHLLGKKKDNEGFTLIELLVVIIIIGILSAIALPSFLSQANKGKQAEAKLNVATINKAQQAYAVENSAWISAISNIGQLNTGIKTASVNYTYGMYDLGSANGAGIGTTGVGTGLLAYSGGVALVYQSGSTTPAAQSIICQSTATAVVSAGSGDLAYTIGNSNTPGSLICTGSFASMTK